MALLPHDEPLREAFDLDIPPDFFTTIVRFALHDAIEAVAHQVARLVGFHAVRQPMDLVARAQRAAKRSHRGGLIPDLVILRFYLPSSDGLPVTRTYDVKTVGYSEKYYRAPIPRGREADADRVSECFSQKVALNMAFLYLHRHRLTSLLIQGAPACMQSRVVSLFELKLGLIQPHMAQKPVLRVEVGCAWRGEGGATTWGYPPRELFGFVRLCIFSYLIEAQRRAQYCGGSAFVS